MDVPPVNEGGGLRNIMNIKYEAKYLGNILMEAKIQINTDSLVHLNPHAGKQ